MDVVHIYCHYFSFILSIKLGGINKYNRWLSLRKLCMLPVLRKKAAQNSKTLGEDFC